MTILAVGGLCLAFFAIRLAPARFRFTLWCLVIVGAVSPWTMYQDHTHWDRVQWIPFVAPPAFKTTDIAINLLLYVPFGLFWSRRAGERPRLRYVLLGAVALSLATEWTQLYSHGRFPSATDVVVNGCGALLGERIARAWRWASPSG